MYNSLHYCDECVFSETDNSLASSPMLSRVSSFTFITCSTLLFPDAFSKEVFISTCSPRSELAVTLVASRPSLSILSLKHLSKVFTFVVLSLVIKILLEVPTLKSRSLVPSLTTMFSCHSLAVLPIMIS